MYITADSDDQGEMGALRNFPTLKFDHNLTPVPRVQKWLISHDMVILLMCPS